MSAAMTASVTCRVVALPPRSGVCSGVGGHALDRPHQPLGRGRLAQMLQHHRAGPEGADRVGDALAGDVEGRAVDRLEHRGRSRAPG